MTTVGELAAHLGLSLGDVDPTLVLEGIAPLASAGPRDIAFVAEQRYLEDLAGTSAACVLIKPEWRDDSPVPTLCVDNPYLTYARVSALFDHAPLPEPGVHPAAVVHPDARLGERVRVGPCACIGAGAVIGDEVVVEAGACIGGNARVGAGSHLFPNVVVYHDVVLGARCIVHANSVIGSDGFGFARKRDGWEKIHQLGAVRVGDDVSIGSGVSIDRGALGDTVIGEGVIIDNQVHIAHNCEIGPRTAIAGCVGFAGSTTIGADCTFAGQVGVSGHLQICDNVHFTGQARVTRSIDTPGTYGSGTPLEPVRQWGRNAVRFSQLDEMARRLKALETELARVTGAASGGQQTPVRQQTMSDASGADKDNRGSDA